VSGVVVQALAADSLLQGRAITPSGALPTITGVVLIALLLGAIPFRRFNWTFPAAVGAVLLILALAPVAIQERWPVSVDSAAMLFCALSCAAVRALLEVRRRVRLNALLDAEIGLPNLRALEARLFALAEPKVLAAASIERFESIRNAIGTNAASELVRDAAARIEALLGFETYRIAPDTLAWLQPKQPGGQDSAARLLDLFREPVETAQGPVDVQLTIGMAGHSPGVNPATGIEHALSAISTARAAGESSHWYHGADPVGRRELSLMGELRRGMALGEVAVAYQPKLDIRTGKIAHAEALVRWRHPVDGLIPPDRFIPLAERTGVIRELTAFVLRRAVAECARLQDSGRQMSVAVNVSAGDLGSVTFIDEVDEAIRGAGADPCCLTLEVTESAIISSPETAIDVLKALRRLGIQVAVDDYGTGQSTLSYLKKLPVNELKIDKSFVTAICANENDRIMVRSTIDLAHELGLKVVAEGVEDAATLQLLQSLGCDFAQGYFIGRAMSFDELIAMAENPLRRPRAA
jgi:EAL domain-containing protein (putative c-di-GMP-specific phosphodiesterase class I)/GGDEF domain-containing protein